MRDTYTGGQKTGPQRQHRDTDRDAGQGSDPTLTPDNGTDPHWRVRYRVGTLDHVSDWSRDFTTVENLAEQYRRDDHFENVVIERRTVIDAQSGAPDAGGDPDA